MTASQATYVMITLLSGQTVPARKNTHPYIRGYLGNLFSTIKDTSLNVFFSWNILFPVLFLHIVLASVKVWRFAICI